MCVHADLSSCFKVSYEPLGSKKWSQNMGGGGGGGRLQPPTPPHSPVNQVYRYYIGIRLRSISMLSPCQIQ